MEKTTLDLSAARKRALAGAAQAEGRSEAELIREGIDFVTSRHQPAEPTIPLFDSGLTDLAETADDRLVGFGDR